MSDTAKLSPSEISNTNLRHLRFLESWALLEPSLHVGSVCVPRIFTYDLIQIMNDTYLQECLSEKGSNESSI